MSQSIEALIRHMIKQNNHNINISFPAVVINTDNLKDGFIDVQPIVRYTNPLTREPVDYPPLYNIRVVFPSNQTSSICFPVNQGDFVDLVIQSVDVQKFINGNAEVHSPSLLSFGNLANVIAFVGFTPYQQSCFNPMNYKNDFDNQDLNIVHNKNTDNEIVFKLTSDGDLKVLNAKKVSYECEEFEVNASEKIKFTSPLISENGR